MSKTYEDHRTHFIYRIKERYGITLTSEEYDELSLSFKPGSRWFKGLLKKDNQSVIGTLYIKGKKVWALYYKTRQCFTTCYPPEVEYDPENCIWMSFPPELRGLALYIYEQYMLERSLISGKKFLDMKQGSIWYQVNTLFFPLHIRELAKGPKAMDLINIMIYIKPILLGKSDYCKLKLVKT
ncbi:MAG: hypothetical protein ABI091_23350 [Ferruginibacter sp.]